MSVNKCKCRLCGDVIESKYRHDFVVCKCGEIFTDGGSDYIRRGAKTDFNNIIDLSDEEENGSRTDNRGTGQLVD